MEQVLHYNDLLIRALENSPAIGGTYTRWRSMSTEVSRQISIHQAGVGSEIGLCSHHCCSLRMFEIGDDSPFSREEGSRCRRDIA